MTTHASTTDWLSNARSNALLHDAAADAFRGKDTVLDWFATITQVTSKEGLTLRAPKECR